MAAASFILSERTFPCSRNTHWSCSGVYLMQRCIVEESHSETQLKYFGQTAARGLLCLLICLGWQYASVIVWCLLFCLALPVLKLLLAWEATAAGERGGRSAPFCSWWEVFLCVLLHKDLRHRKAAGMPQGCDQAALWRGCCTAREEGGEGRKTRTWCSCGDFALGAVEPEPGGRDWDPFLQGITLMSPGCIDMKRAVPLYVILFVEATHELLERFHSCKDKEQFHLSGYIPKAWRLWQAVSHVSVPSHPAPASKLPLLGWHLLCQSLASQMLALRWCPGRQPCSGSHTVEGSTHLSPGTHRDRHFTGDLCPASSLSASSTVPRPTLLGLQGKQEA